MLNLIFSLIFYIIGILSNYYDLVNIEIICLFGIITTLSYLVKNINVFISFFVSFSFFLIGYYNCQFQKYEPEKNDISIFTPIKLNIDGIVNSEIKRSDRFSMFELKLVKVSNINLYAKGNIFVVTENKNTKDLNYGDKVLVKGKINIPKDSYNYGEFSFKEYLSRKNIFSVMNANEIIILKSNYKVDWYSYLISIRKK
ncbi:MAG: hypothetical protein KatS3mg068_0444 [Candidatus Sericytochromatia bacterium]|nr:MAG: hypothetical protein KatS3mg068_0444 [Candidatus Sericytochromatia bacterium]